MKPKMTKSSVNIVSNITNLVCMTIGCNAHSGFILSFYDSALYIS